MQNHASLDRESFDRVSWTSTTHSAVMIHLTLLSSCTNGIWRFLEYRFWQTNKLEFFISCYTFFFYAESRKKFTFFSACSVDIYFFVKTKLLFTSWVGRFSLFFLYLHQIYTFNDNFNDEETLIFHLMQYLNYSTL